MTNTPAATRATPHAVDQFASRLSGFAIASTADAATCMAFRAGYIDLGRSMVESMTNCGSGVGSSVGRRPSERTHLCQ